MNQLLSKLSFVIVLFSIIACSQDDPDTITYDCNNNSPTYTADIKSIVDSKCATSGCHNAGSSAAGINLSSYNSVSAEADKARFRGSIEHVAGYRNMPLNGTQLSEEDRKSIYCWVESGKPQ